MMKYVRHQCVTAASMGVSFLFVLWIAGACSSSTAPGEADARAGCDALKANYAALAADKTADASTYFDQQDGLFRKAVAAGGDIRFGQGLTSKAKACSELYGVDVYHG